MSIISMVQGGSGAGNWLNLPGRVGQYLLARRAAIPDSRGGRHLGDRAAHDDGDLGRATPALDLVFGRRRLRPSRKASGSKIDFLEKEGPQTAEVTTSAGCGSSTTTLSICGDSQELGGFLPSAGLPVDAFPFVVGRLPEAWESAPDIAVNVRLKESRPYRMSRAHFAILRTEDGFQVRDLESTLGTSVNDVLLGRHSGCDRISLRRGDNTVTAGGIGSQFRFKLVW